MEGEDFTAGDLNTKYEVIANTKKAQHYNMPLQKINDIL